MTTIAATRPRNVDSWRAAGILYGDWGTSKAYVLGLAFAFAGYSSFWFILAVSILIMLVGINYISICKFYPNGGGVYASVRKRSKVLSFVGAFFLIADYIVTAALSALSAFHYLGAPHPELWAILSIFAIGALNFLGPKETGSLAVVLAIPTVMVVLCLGLMSIPFLPTAIQNLEPVPKDIFKDMSIFVGIIIALSGIESIANTTGSMRLDHGSTNKKPSVVKTSTPAIIMVMVEVCVLTTLLGLAMNALPGLQISNGDVNAPGYPNVRDAMLRYMGDYFASSLFGPTVGTIFSYMISIVISLLLLSAVNTAIIALISLLYVMSHDGELPAFFHKLNRFGVPIYGTLISFIVPIVLLILVSDIAGLASLYAIGFVGAIAVNLASTSTNFKLELKIGERGLMMFTALIMFIIEIFLFIDKPSARIFVIAVMVVGLLLRAIVRESKEIEAIKEKRPLLPAMPEGLKNGILVAVKGVGNSLTFALEESQGLNIPLYVLFVREHRVVDEKDNELAWMDDDQASEVYDYLVKHTPPKTPIDFFYTVTPYTAHAVAEFAIQKKVCRIIIGRRREVSPFMNIFRGTTAQDIARRLPDKISLVVIY